MKITATHYRTGRPREFDLPGKSPAKTPLLYGPAFVDLQCNGFAGCDFNHPSATPPDVARAILAMRKTGCATVLPTVITHSAERMEQCFRTLIEAARLDRQISAAMPAFHLEGPFLSPADGPRGAHPAAHIREPSIALFRRLQKAAEGRIRLVTLAPESRGAPGFIRRLRQEGIAAAIGHTAATRGQIAAAADAGATVSTHLGNGCAASLDRHRNPIFPQLADDRLTATLIADGIHLPPDVLKTFFRAKGPRRIALITDAMAAAAAPPGRYTLGDLTLEVGADRIVRQPGKTNFAGSALTLIEGIARLIAAAGATVAEAWDCAAVVPRSLVGLPPAREILLVRQSVHGLEAAAILPARSQAGSSACGF